MPSRIDRHGNLVIFKAKTPDTLPGAGKQQETIPEIHPIISPFPPPRPEDMEKPVPVQSPPPKNSEVNKTVKAITVGYHPNAVERPNTVVKPKPTRYHDENSQAEKTPQSVEEAMNKLKVSVEHFSAQDFDTGEKSNTTETFTRVRQRRARGGNKLRKAREANAIHKDFDATARAEAAKKAQEAKEISFCTTCNVEGHTTEACFLTNPASLATFLERFPEQKGYWKRQVREYQQTVNSQIPPRPARECYWCGKKGHIQRDCKDYATYIVSEPRKTVTVGPAYFSRETVWE